MFILALQVAPRCQWSVEQNKISHETGSLWWWNAPPVERTVRTVYCGAVEDELDGDSWGRGACGAPPNTLCIKVTEMCLFVHFPWSIKISEKKPFQTNEPPITISVILKLLMTFFNLGSKHQKGLPLISNVLSCCKSGNVRTSFQNSMNTL